MRISSLVLKIFLVIFGLANLAGCKNDQNGYDSKLVLEVESLSVSSLSSEHTLELLANQPWNAESDADWISLAQKNGDKGKAKIAFSVSENEGDKRTGYITVAINEVSKKIQVVQESGENAEYYVKEDGTGGGTSWDDATSLVNALNLATSGNTIYIAAGIYKPTETVTGGDPADDGDLTFEISKYLTLKGGYPENAEDDASSDPKNHKTILSGQLANGNETYHVVTVTAPKIEKRKVILDGLTISGGNASSSATSITINGTDFRRDYGGGVTIGNAGIEINNSEIVNNNSGKFAAGLYIFGESYVMVRNSKINNNYSENNVGGLWVKNSTAHIYNTELNDNSSKGTAPAVHGYPNATIYMYNSIIANNMGTSFGAAFYVRDNSKGILVNSLITGNESTSTHGGGGVMMYNNCEVDIISTTITDNKIAGPGGGLYRQKGTNLVNIYNSIISGNKQQDGSSDLDVHENNAQEPSIMSSIIGTNVYDGAGNEITEINFNADDMLNGSYVPIEGDNPTIDYGMDIDALIALGSSFEPSIEEDYVTTDMKGKDRSTLTTMGPLVE